MVYEKVKKVEYRDTRQDIWRGDLPSNIGAMWMEFFKEQMELKKQNPNV